MLVAFVRLYENVPYMLVPNVKVPTDVTFLPTFRVQLSDLRTLSIETFCELVTFRDLRSGKYFCLVGHFVYLFVTFVFTSIK